MLEEELNSLMCDVGRWNAQIVLFKHDSLVFVSFVAQLEPTSQIVICFLFAQPLVCKLLSVNQATNYTAAAAERNHFDLRGCLE